MNKNESVPFTPEQARWINEAIAAELARDTAYIMRVGNMTRSAILWFGGLLATGMIGFSAVNWMALKAFETPDTLIKGEVEQIRSELNRKNDSLLEALNTSLREKVSEYGLKATSLSNVSSDVARLKDEIESDRRGIKVLLEGVTEKVDRVLPEVVGALDTARAGARQIEEFAQTAMAYSVAYNIKQSESAIAEEVATRLIARSDFFELLAAKHLAPRMLLRLAKDSCREDELLIQNITIDVAEGQRSEERLTCLKLSEEEDS